MTEITAPNGAVITFPDEMSPDDIHQVMLKQFPPQDALSRTVSAAKDVGTGLERGVINLAGMPGDVQGLAHTGINWLADKVSPQEQNLSGLITGQKPPPRDVLANFPLKMSLPGSEDVQNWVESKVGKLREPEDRTGRWIQGISSWVPAALAGPGNLARKLVTNAVVPGAATQATGEALEGSPLKPYAEFAAGLGSMAAANRLINPIKMASSDRQQYVDALKNEGVSSLTAGQITGARPLRWAESVAMDTPFAGKNAEAMNEAAGKEYTRAILSKAGESADLATTPVVDGMFSRISDGIERTVGLSGMRLDPQLGQDMASTANNYHQLVMPPAPIIASTMNHVLTTARAQGGSLTGRQYQDLRSSLHRQARATPDPPLQDALRGMAENLDDAMERSLAASNHPQSVGDFRKYRRQWNNARVVADAVAGAGPMAARGFISPQALAGAVKNNVSRIGYSRGYGDFNDLSHAGNVVMDRLPNSGTSAREQINRTIHNLGYLAGGGIGYHVGGEPFGVFGLLGGGPAADVLNTTLVQPAVARTMMSNPVQAYLGGQTELQRALGGQVKGDNTLSKLYALGLLGGQTSPADRRQ